MLPHSEEAGACTRQNKSWREALSGPPLLFFAVRRSSSESAKDSMPCSPRSPAKQNFSDIPALYADEMQ